jgi:hypothetical protein
METNTQDKETLKYEKGNQHKQETCPSYETIH